MQFIKNIWASWKVQISFVGGALVVATTFGTCTVQPDPEAIQDAVLPVEEGSEESPKSESKEEPKEKEAPKSEEPVEPPVSEAK
jgi:hypothetical protein